MSSYTKLTQEQRYQIQTLMKAGHNHSEIVKIVDVHKSTISHEITRNQGLRGYRPKQIQNFTLNRRQGKSQPRIGATT
jgi:IS30 family transposase